MATITLTRTPNQTSQVSNTVNPQARQFEWYETTYTTTGPQTWFTIPDFNGVSVTLSMSSSTASVECTDSPPDVVDSGSPVIVTWPAGVVGVTTSALLIGFTAFRVNVATGSSVKVSVRC
jgi:hypothetical protein